jgi:hypothetical protein
MIDQKQLENVENFYYLGGVITADSKCRCEIKLRLSMAKAAFKKKKKKNLVTSQLELNLTLLRYHEKSYVNSTMGSISPH